MYIKNRSYNNKNKLIRIKNNNKIIRIKNKKAKIKKIFASNF